MGFFPSIWVPMCFSPYMGANVFSHYIGLWEYLPRVRSIVLPSIMDANVFFPVVKWVLIFFLLLGSMGVFIQNECQFFSKYMGANVYFSVGIWEIILFPGTWVY